MYADDTVIFYSDKDPQKIEKFLNADMKSIQQYCYLNELIVNTKKGKTEVMLFGSSKRLHSVGKKIDIIFNNNLINFVTNYKYLGIIVDETMTLKENFDKSYRKASSRLRLLEMMNEFTTLKARVNIYLSMILPF